MKNSYVIVMVTTTNKEEAEKIAQTLLDEKWIACANIIGPVSSLFTWKGKTEKAEEYLLLMKSRLNLFEKLSKKVKSLHSYEIPEIIAIPITEAFKNYLEWLNNSLR